MKPRLTSPFARPVAVLTTAALIAHVAAVPAHAAELPALAAQVTAGQVAVQNMQVSFSSGVVTITYDLAAVEGRHAFDVELEVSTNGGQTYDVQPRSMSGDIGSPVSAGRGKRIVWEFAKDVETVQTNQFRFRVVIRVEARADGTTPSAAEAPAQTRPGLQLPTPPGAPPPARQASGGNRLLWPGLGMFGAGGALAAMAGAGPLRKRTDFRDYYELTPNKGAMYGGIGVAATGLVLLLVGRRGASSPALIVPIPGGVMLYRTTPF